MRNERELRGRLHVSTSENRSHKYKSLREPQELTAATDLGKDRNQASKFPKYTSEAIFSTKKVLFKY